MAAEEGAEPSASADWRKGLGTIAEQQLYMLEHGLYSDCTFTLAPEQKGETREFLLHRHVLSRCSEVFEAMLLPSGRRMLEAQTGQVTITDIQPGIFHAALKYMYAGQDSEISALTLGEVLGVSGVADKYRIFPLQAACEQRLCSLLDPDCVWRLLRDVCETLQGYEGLREKCVQVLRKDTRACLRSLDLGCVSECSVALLLQQEALSLEGELPLVLAATHWARLEAARSGRSVRAVLEPRLLPLLRLPSLSQEQLETVCGLAEWVSLWEREALRARNLDTLPEGFSRNKERRGVIGVRRAGPLQGSVFCLERCISPWEPVKNVDCNWAPHRVLLQVSEPVWLKGVFFSNVYYKESHCHSISAGVPTFKLKITTFTMGGIQEQFNDFGLAVFEESGVETKIFLPNPFRLMDGKTYCIDIKPYRPANASKKASFSKYTMRNYVTASNSKVTFKFNERCDGQFESLISGEDILSGLCFTL